MKVRLWTDAPMVNIALMKLSAYHKSKGDDVAFHRPVFDADADLLYCSKLFRFTPDYEYVGRARVINGGTGYDVGAKLPTYVDSVRDLDYSLYEGCDYSMQFFSRGCVRRCPFCVVREKEGRIYPVEPMSLNPNGKRIEILDNNFFANPEWMEAVRKIHEWGQPINLHGVDVRMLTEYQAKVLDGLPHYKQIHIAWDDPRTDMEKHIKRMLKHVKPYKVMCYVLIGYWSTPDEDLCRVEKLRELGVDPFVMAFDRADQYQRDFQRWCNHKAIFKSVPWSVYRRELL